MKRSKCILVAVLALATALAASHVASAQGGWNTGIDIQNLTGTPGSVVVAFYNSDGSSAGSLSDTIDAWGSLNFYLLDEPAPPDGGRYSVVIYADVDIAATAGQANYTLGGADIYLGTADPEDTLIFPLVYRNHTAGLWNSQITVQNASNSEQTVNLSLYSVGETVPDATDSATIQPNASHTFDISEAQYAAFGPFGSAVVDGSGPLAGMVDNIRNPGTGKLDVIETTYRAFGSAQQGGQLFAPLTYKNFNSWTTGVNVINTGGVSTTVTISYTSQSLVGGPWVDSMVLDANSMATFYTPVNGDLPDGFFGSAELASSDTDIAAVVSSQRYLPGGAMGVAYEASLPSDATSCVSLPVVHNRTTWETGINLVNLGSSQANITIDYHSSSASVPDASQDIVIPANSPLSLYLPLDGTTGLGFFGAADIKCTNGQPLLTNASHSRFDQGVSSNYVGVNYTCPP